MPRLTLALCAVAAALNPLQVCHHKTCSKNGLAKRTLDIAHVLGGPEAAVQTLECQNGCNAGTVSVVGRRLYDVERASAATLAAILEIELGVEKPAGLAASVVTDARYRTVLALCQLVDGALGELLVLGCGVRIGRGCVKGDY